MNEGKSRGAKSGRGLKIALGILSKRLVDLSSADVDVGSPADTTNYAVQPVASDVKRNFILPVLLGSRFQLLSYTGSGSGWRH